MGCEGRGSVMSDETRYAAIAEIELARWVSEALETLEENMTEATTKLENLEQERTRLKMWVSVLERRQRALQNLKAQNGHADPL